MGTLAAKEDSESRLVALWSTAAFMLLEALRTIHRSTAEPHRGLRETSAFGVRSRPLAAFVLFRAAEWFSTETRMR